MTVIYAGGALLALGVILYGCVRIAKDPLLGVCLFVFLSSITMMPQLPVVGDRLAFADLVMLYTLLVCTVRGHFFRPPLPGLKLVDQLALLFIAIATISSLLALFRDGDPVRVVLFLLIYAYGYCCFRIIIRMIRDRETLKRLMIWWLAGAILVIVIGFLAGTGVYRPAWTFDPVIGRINATFKMSGQVASYLGPAMFILFYLAGTRRLSRPLQLGVLSLIFAGAFVLLGAGSRTSFMIMVISVGAGTWVMITSAQRRLRRVPLLFASISAVTAFSLFALSVWSDTSSQYRLTSTSPFERAIKMWSEQTSGGWDIEELGGTRYDEISAVLENFDKAPLTGTGSGMFSQTYKINEVHNTYFSVLGENGLIAFIIFLFWWAFIFVTLRKPITRARGEEKVILKLVFWAFLTLSLYQMTINGMRQRPFWFIPALAVATSAVLRQPRSSRMYAHQEKDIQKLLQDSAT